MGAAAIMPQRLCRSDYAGFIGPFKHLQRGRGALAGG